MSSEVITRNDLKNILNELLPMFYPVGSYYETSDLSFNPNIEWGGRWELETQGQVHVSAGSSWSVNGALTNTTDGGTTQVPYHNHTHNITYTQNSSGSCTIASSAAHTHTGYYRADGSKSDGGTRDRIGHSGSYKGTLTTVSSSGAHSHTVPNHTHTGSISGGVGYAGDSNYATNPNMPPYIVVNRWHRMPDTYFTLNLGSDTKTFYFTGTPTWSEFIASQWNIDSVFSADAEDKVMYDMSSWLLTENDVPVEITDNVSTGTYLVEMPE